MKVDYTALLTIFLAIIAASLVEHLVIAPRMAHSPGKTLPSSPAVPRTIDDWVTLHYPNAIKI